MCGIAGIFQLDNKLVDKAELKRMAQLLKHRGPDGEGFWVNSQKKIGLAHRRLSILDLSEAGKQPMTFKNRYTITFNGEIYNFLELKDELKKKQYQFYTNTDTEVILAAYDFYGPSCLERFDGMFAFVIWDEDKQELFCARDRFGEKPFFYSFLNSRFVFASEMKALITTGTKKEINRKKVFEYLLYLNVENPLSKAETFYNNIFQLEPATYLKINLKGEKKKKQYWSLDTTTRNFEPEKVVTNKFQEIFYSSVTKRLRSDVEIGSSLSGGLDSSSIVCVVNGLLQNNSLQHVFSARFPGFIKDEGHHIDNVISYCENAQIEKHEVFPNERTMLQNLEKIMYFQEVPFGSSSIAAQFEVMKLASDSKVKVLLDGQGADEVLAGYPTYFNAFLLGKLKINPFKYFKEKNKLKRITGDKLSDLNGIKFFSSFFNDIHKKITNRRRKRISNSSPYFKGMNEDFVKSYKGEPNPIFKTTDLKEHLKFALMHRGLNELLRYADRNSMANSIEVRLPFLSHELVEFVFSLPEHYFINNGWTKIILRKSMKGKIPKSIQWRKDKIGYEPPQAKWMNHPEIIDKVKVAQQKLIKDKILAEGEHEINWQHLMLGMLYD